MSPTGQPVRRATAADAVVLASLLRDFNAEYDYPCPPVEVLASRLTALLAGPSTFALLAGDPAVGCALVTRRPNVWYSGPVLLLDELYVAPGLRGRGIGSEMIAMLLADADAERAGMIEINVDEGDIDAQRFYRRHGFLDAEPGGDERAFYFWRELEPLIDGP